MNLRLLSNSDLNQRMITIARKEKELLAAAILHIAEVEHRKLYFEYGQRSLYKYLILVGFSNGSAYRLMDAARLQLQVPELAEKIESGKINMTQVRLVQEGARQSAKQIASEEASQLESLTGSLFLVVNETDHDSNPQLLKSDANRSDCLEGTGSGPSFLGESVKQNLKPIMDAKKSKHENDCRRKAELLNSLQGLSASDSQRVVAQKFDVNLKQPSKVTHQKDGSVLVEMVFSAEEWAEIQRAKLNLSNSLPVGSDADVIVHLARQENRKRLKPAKPRPSTVELTPAKKKFVLQRDQCCQFRDPNTGALCGSQFHLQVDHIQPLWAGGSHEVENLQALCAVHNRLKYRKESGVRIC